MGDITTDVDVQLPVKLSSVGEHGPTFLEIADGAQQTVVPAPGVGKHLYVRTVSIATGAQEEVKCVVRDEGVIHEVAYLSKSGGQYSRTYDPIWKLRENRPLVCRLGAVPSRPVAVNVDFVTEI